MGVSDKVRKRRQDRIRYLQEKAKRDPEYAWKYREHLWETADAELSPDRSVHANGWQSRSGWTEMRGKLSLSLLLFVLVWFIFQLDEPWALKGQRFVSTSLTQQADFKSMEVWYSKWFGGAPAWIPDFPSRKATEVNIADRDQVYTPVPGNVKALFDETHKGITLETALRAQVVAFDEGQVVSITELGTGDLLVMIQHKGGIQTLYGYLGNSKLRQGDWVKGGDVIGEVSAQDAHGRLFFAIKQDLRYINPLDVIDFD